MSTLKADILTTKSDNTDLTITGGGTGVPNLESGFKVGGTVEKLTGVAPSTSGNVLTSDGTDWTSAAAAGGGAWTLIGTNVASASASLTQTGLDSTYDTFAVILSDMISATDTVSCWIRLGDSGGIDSGSSDYKYIAQSCRFTSTAWGAEDGSGAAKAQILIGSTSPTHGNATGEGLSATFYLDGTSASAKYPMIHGSGRYNDNFTRPSLFISSGGRDSDITLDRVQFLFSTGNITSGRMTVWGISHA